MMSTIQNLKPFLDTLYLEYQQKYSADDPIWLVHELSGKKNQEVFAFILSCFCYGSIKSIKNTGRYILERTDYNPYEFILEFEPTVKGRLFTNFYYRFNNSKDLITLFVNLQNILIEKTSLLNAFLQGYEHTHTNILPALNNFTKILRKKILKGNCNYRHLIPDAGLGSPCKRLNLFLRWMVRKDEIDLGLWYGKITPDKLLMPVDTHIYRVSHELQLVNRKQCDIKFALELTERLKLLSPDDPVKYDFSLCHQEIKKRIERTQSSLSHKK
ncbi:MAG: TIGR02757 family protein [Ignavibacteria bacterium]